MSGINFSVRFDLDTIYLKNNSILPDGYYNDLEALELEIKVPTGELIKIGPATASLLNVSHFSIIFNKQVPYQELPISLVDILENNSAGRKVLTKNGEPAVLTTFPDGTYEATLKLDIGSKGTYSSGIKFYSLSQVDRIIATRVDPSAGFYTIYKGSPEEKRALDAVVKILALRESLIIDFTNGFETTADAKLGVLRKYARICPVFKCDCA